MGERRRRRPRGAAGMLTGCLVLAGLLPAGLLPAGLGPAPAQARPDAGPGGRTLVRDPAPTGVVTRRAPGAVAAAGPSAPFALARTFALHSLPGSQHTILLDFDGATVSGTAWNAPDMGLPARSYRGWVLDGQTYLGAVQRRDIQDIWLRVAEDFAPFDVDVTTEDPGQDALDRSGPDDPVYGTRVLISSSATAQRAACAGVCSGSAYFDVVDLADRHDYWQPAWVFADALGDVVRDIANAISHEVGHNFGLLHDGTATEGYYAGHHGWAPIMGSSFTQPISQWSRGAYPDADNQQDDLALIAAHGAPLRADEAVDTTTGAGPLPSGPAYITSDGDRDVYALGTCAGPVVVRARGAPVSPDLDIRLRLLDAAGTVLATANPVSAKVTRDVASGMSAAISTTLAAGSYWVSVEGVGRGGALRAYDGYASIGAYTLTQTGCSWPTG